ncbi:MAG: transcription-repair coupling factor [Spirochaetales bacterium]|nr:transcription-repair coupling factor [Spirochaetales bacterium]
MKILDSFLRESTLYRDFLRQPGFPRKAFGIDGLPLLRLCACLLESRRIDGNLYLVCPTEETARQMYSDCKVALFSNRAVFLPSDSRVYYSSSETGAQDLARAKALEQIQGTRGQLVIVPLRAFVSPVPTPESLKRNTVRLQNGGAFDSSTLATRLSESGYIRVPTTSMAGEFSIRGEVADVFPKGAEEPVRVFCDWDRIGRIAVFDPISQQTVRELESVSIPLAVGTDQGQGFITQYTGRGDFFVFCGQSRLENSYKSLTNEARSLYRKAYMEDRLVKRPEEMLLDFPVFCRGLAGKLTVLDLDTSADDVHRFQIDGPRSYFGNFTFLRSELEGLLGNGWTVDIWASSAIQSERLKQMLSTFDGIGYHTGVISGGFGIPQKKYIVMGDFEIFGRRRQVTRTISKTQSSPLDSFVELNEGDYIVHVNYGVGRFLKIDRVNERDYIKIQYSGDDVLYVPIEQANLVQRYIGSAGAVPHIDRLGTSGWENKKARARENAEKLAKSLIDLYARRKQTTGFPFGKDTDWQLQFEAQFPFDETEDQLACIDDIKKDMESPVVMDRLICGDVGYGKTEIAFRAAFKAVMCSKQVAFLAPTTILAEQHFRNFQNRCGSFPVRSALMSRMVSPKQIKKAIAQLKDGSLDIIFGTHRILQKDVVFNDLGLLVVDEEQRFGVKDKERIKQLKTNVDCLSLSATPIPRTLYMSLLKIRDMSLLTTAPISRRPIHTRIGQFDLGQVVGAIREEVSRQGQVFYLHNRIETLEEVVLMLRREMPDILIESVHGQMEASEVDDIMRRFIYEGIQVLVSTTIIENGIDIPNVNTIIIDRADLYGLSQLYQLRGRVGRSDRQAWAYLFYPGDRVISEDALKRLKVIGENTELGSGFKVAMKDMEIRGAGNILGREQSGQMASVGLDMYMRLLDEAITTLRQSPDKVEREVYFELDYSGFIPDSYISAPSVKFEIYKKIASVKEEEALSALTAELQNRFGPMPEEVSNLLYIAELKIICRKLGIYHLKETRGTITAEFSRMADVPIDRLIDLVRTSNGAVKLNPNRPNIMTMTTQAISLKDKSLFLLEKFQRLVT